MPSDNLKNRLEAISSDFHQNVCEEVLRDELQNFFDAVFSSEETEIKNRAFGLLGEMRCAADNCPDGISCDVCALLENLTVCCDLILAENPKRFFFNGESITFAVNGSPSELGWAFMCVLAEAAVGSEYISVTQTDRTDKTIIYIESETTDFRELRLSGKLLCAERIIRACGGTLVCSFCGGRRSAVVALPRADEATLCACKIPAVCDFLCDRLSIVYTALYNL